VFYGNIGGAARLDFTAVGPAVNLASRLEALAKQLDRSPLASADFVAACAGGARFEALGARPVRGLAEPVEVFALAR
jgi:adenylate cyclase